MAANFYGWLVNKLRYKRLAVAGPTKLMAFGAIYNGPYSNWKHDPKPLIWIQWCDERVTHGINIHYLNRSDKQWFGRLIYLIKRANQNIDPKTFYNLLNQQRHNMIKTAYRIYHTNLLNVKLVSAGITPLDDLIYTTSMDPWIAALNEMIRPSEMPDRPPARPIAFSPTELQERITQARNSVDLRTKSVGPKAPYAGQAPFVRGK